MARLHATYTVRLSPEASKRLEAEAKRKGVSATRIATEALEKVYNK